MESAPNSNLNDHLEVKMPWTPQDVETAEIILSLAEDFDHNINWLGRIQRAVNVMQLDDYFKSDKYSGIRSYISHKGAEARKLKLDSEPIRKTPEEIWQDDLKNNESMQHGLHPEDEADIIKKLSKSD